MGPKAYAYSVTSDPAYSEAADRRMADLALFAKGVVHDLRNPLNVIVANLYLLRQRLEGADARTLRPVDRLTAQVTTLEQMLTGYLAFDLAEHPALQRLDVNSVVSAFVDAFVMCEGYSLQVETEELPVIEADPRLLDAALRAAVRNSLRAMTGEGTVVLRTRAAGGVVRLVVEDTGPGIEPAVLARVFEPFFSTWSEHAGIGLPLIDRVARAHRGKASVSTTPGEGTQVTIELPSVSSATVGSAHSPESQP
jgi:signal transduction histidine kinase